MDMDRVEEQGEITTIATRWKFLSVISKIFIILQHSSEGLTLYNSSNLPLTL